MAGKREQIPENTRRKQGTGRFKPGQSGNPAGKPPGARHKTTLAMEMLLEGEGEALTRKAIEMALLGDNTAMRLCLERLLPARRDKPVRFALPKLETSADALKASIALVEAVAAGELTPIEAGEVSRTIETFTKVYDSTELERRLAAIEGEGGAHGAQA